MSCKKHTKSDVRIAEITVVRAVGGEYDETTVTDIWCPSCGKTFTRKGYNRLLAGVPDERSIIFDGGAMKSGR